nr:GGDEF domain-containing protein [Sphingomonas sp. BT553]
MTRYRCRGPLPDGTYVELVGSLCSTRLPAVIMTALFTLVGSLALMRSGDVLLQTLLVLGVTTSACRLWILFGGRRQFDAGSMTAAVARRFERLFAGFYIGFAAIVGMLAARVIALPLPSLDMPVGILVVGYAAGVAATTALRPHIAIPSLLLSVGPLAIAVMREPGLEHGVSAVCLIALLAGGLRSLSQRYQSQAAKTTARQAFGQLARHDHLTGLYNRLALTEAFGRLRQAGAATGFIAVHYIDLDDFKPVNDQLGHLAGDALLRAIADRLRSELPAGDITARIGGDEFVVIQTGVSSHADVGEKAINLEHMLARPFRVDSHPIAIGASVGSSGPARVDADLEWMMRRADEELRSRKAQRKSSDRYARLTSHDTLIRVI